MGASGEMIANLRAEARSAASRAYCPYSKFRVGAALVTSSGQVYSGCNVENASYGLTSCAERNAVFQMIAAGDRSIEAIVIYTPTPTATAPCGACRQVLNEFNPNVRVICDSDGETLEFQSLHEILPSAFGPANLSRARQQNAQHLN